MKKTFPKLQSNVKKQFSYINADFYIAEKLKIVIEMAKAY